MYRTINEGRLILFWPEWWNGAYIERSREIAEDDLERMRLEAY